MAYGRQTASPDYGKGDGRLRGSGVAEVENRQHAGDDGEHRKERAHRPKHSARRLKESGLFVWTLWRKILLNVFVFKILPSNIDLPYIGDCFSTVLDDQERPDHTLRSESQPAHALILILTAGPHVVVPC
jgi:hypothetical protein